MERDVNKPTESIQNLEAKLFDANGRMYDCECTLDYVEKALSMIKDKYEWAHVPDIREAYKVYNTPGGPLRCTENERNSYDYVMGYGEIMFLINVALDYCFKAKEYVALEVC